MKSDLLAQKSLIEKCLRQRPQQLSALSFVNIFLWSDFFSYELHTFGENLCVFASHEVGTFQYLPPLSKGFDLTDVERCFAFMREKNQGRGTRCGVGRIENVGESELSIFPPERFSVYQKGYDYLYFRRDLDDPVPA